MQRTTEEIQEIERHKYFMSEKRGYDVGWEAAEQDWEQNYGLKRREDEESVPIAQEAEAVCEVGAMCAPESAYEPETACHSDSARETDPIVRVAHGTCEAEPSAGTLRRWLSRIFAK